MGEKDIVGDTALGGGVVVGGGGQGIPGGTTGGPPGGATGGGTTDTGGGGGGGPRTGGGPGGSPGSPGSQVDDCAQLEFKARELIPALEAAGRANAAAANKALDAFYSRYKPAIQGAKVTDAVVSSNNAVGEAIIDVAIKVAGYIEGGEDYAKKGEQVKGKVLEDLKNWMKEGATSGELEAAKRAYADFAAAAAETNASAARAKDLKKQLDDLRKQSEAIQCPGFPPIPDPSTRTIDISSFGKGAEHNEAGPTLTTERTSATIGPQDLFRAGSTARLTI